MREWRCNFSRMFRTWFLTVFSEMNSSCPISRLFIPLATSLRTSSSRSVRRRAGGGARLLLDRDLFEEVARGARLDGFVQVRLFVGDREHQDLGRRLRVLDRAGCLYAGPARHANVHEDHIGGRALGP